MSLATKEPSDIQGIPTPVGDLFYKFLLNETFNKILENEKAGVKTLLFLDEINQGTPQIFNAIYSLILESKIENIFL